MIGQSADGSYLAWVVIKRYENGYHRSTLAKVSRENIVEGIYSVAEDEHGEHCDISPPSFAEIIQTVKDLATPPDINPTGSSI